MLGKPRILSLSPTRLIDSIKHGHSCKILYNCNKGSTHVRSSIYSLFQVQACVSLDTLMMNIVNTR